MASLKITLSFSLLVVIIFILSHCGIANAQLSPAPEPASDGSSIDLGIAYALMFATLAVTYLMHPVDAFPFNLL
ncbi:hypothetical protein L7F22_055920 [Adiantum nelumboides]|nr:hypothetical protein [Adiantum nelumboides]